MSLKYKWIRDFYKQFNVKLIMRPANKNHSGFAYSKERKIVLYKNPYLQQTPYGIHLVVHELCHILSYDYGFFKNYYHSKRSSNKYIRRIWLKKELFTDKMAHKIIRSLFPTLPLDRGYDNPYNRKYAKDYINKRYK